MKVTILTGPWLPVPALRGGAVPKIWHGLALEFARAGHEVTVVARTFPGQPREERVAGVRFLRTRGFSQSGRIRVDLVKDLLYALNVVPRLPPADILITNDFWVPAIAARFRRRAGLVVVAAGRVPKGQYGLYLGVARVIAVSEAVRDAIRAEQPSLAGRTIAIPVPVDLAPFRHAPASPKGTGRTLLYAGRIHPEKGIELLLRAFQQLRFRFPLWRLTFVGPVNDSEGGGGAAFATAVRDLGREEGVEWIDPIWDADRLAEVYSSADLFCYPSLAELGEAFGAAPLESMAAGVPPIVSDLACFRDFVRDGENGWVFDHRGTFAEERLAAVLARTMADESLRAQAGMAARKTAERFALPAVAGEYLAEFERIVAEARSLAQR